ncbi:GntP family permease [Actinobacillus equuli subsp. equuli]|uniref:GntP family permease n=2 Tax=Actinobacillus equuli TaxID=718 RepID=A0A0A7MGJ4_ACTEU|nr:GntP family permease [Actinobacillus equuli]AIZ79760.1 transporter [Actinobacillus equuli subsp. equuli]MDE8034500.1 GntP family permease [Actinobacillus equuli subsp. equuli]MDG4947551.1 GntP family permease [Actinobacillus equuli subsp. haemolyticus]MDG4952992.1 GntP family permease [Actinobacillus equuli subsp. equuli]WGE43871.1 GntP family permease [Actinobacillus equuli subsp. equuli]
MFSLLGIFIGLVLLMYLAFRGYSIVWIAPLCATIVAFTGDLNVLDAYLGSYMNGLVDFVKAWFPAFLLSAIFGNLMDVSGGAKSIAVWLTKALGSKSAIASIVLGCALLTYGGVSLFVVVFAVYPLALAVFKEANITRRLIPGTIACGAFTFTMTALPGSPQIQNLIPTRYFGTDAMAAPIMGIIASAVLFFGGVAYLEMRRRKYAANGIFFTEPHSHAGEVENEKLPNPLLAILPLISVIGVLNFVPAMIGLKSNDPKNIVLALIAGITLAVVLNWNKRDKFIPAIGKGANGAVGAIINTAAAVGFGSVVRMAPGFEHLTTMILNIPGSPLISISVAVNVLAGATGSASGGMGIALEALGEKYLAIAKQANISPETFHRISSLSSGGLDTMPHNGAVLTLLSNTGMTHKESYLEIAVTSFLLPIVATVIVITIFSLFGIY